MPCPRSRETHRQGVPIEPISLRRKEHRQPAIGDLSGERNVLWAFGREIDRDIRAQGMHGRLKRLAQTHPVSLRHLVVLSLERDRLLARENLAHDLHVLSSALERTGVGLSVPALHYLWPRGANAEDEAAA